MTDCGCEAKCTFGYRLKVMIRTTSPCTTIDGSCGLCGNHNGEIALGSVQGYCAGLMPPVPTKKNLCDDVACQATKTWNLCCNTDFECPYTVAYGKWMMVWDSSIAAKVGSNLTCDRAQTAWGNAKPAKLKDDRACGQTLCDKNSCGE